MSGYFSEKRGLKNIYEKLCLKYTKILEAFNIQSMNNSKEFINSSKQNRFHHFIMFSLFGVSISINCLFVQAQTQFILLTLTSYNHKTKKERTD